MLFGRRGRPPEALRLSEFREAVWGAQAPSDKGGGATATADRVSRLPAPHEPTMPCLVGSRREIVFQESESPRYRAYRADLHYWLKSASSAARADFGAGFLPDPRSEVVRLLEERAARFRPLAAATRQGTPDGAGPGLRRLALRAARSVGGRSDSSDEVRGRRAPRGGDLPAGSDPDGELTRPGMMAAVTRSPSSAGRSARESQVVALAASRTLRDV